MVGLALATMLFVSVLPGVCVAFAVRRHGIRDSTGAREYVCNIQHHDPAMSTQRRVFQSPPPYMGWTNGFRSFCG